MWILPKQLISRFAPDTEALTSDSAELSQTCERSLIRRSKHSPAKTYLREWKAGNLMRLRYGAISSRSLGQSFVTEWTSCLAVTPVNLSAQPGNDLEQKTHDIFGPTSQAEFKFFDQNSVSSRTSKDTLALDSEKSLENWKSWVTRCRGAYSQRKNASIATDAARRTSANEFSLWPTIKVRQGQDCASERRRESPSLDSIVKQQLEKCGPLAPANHSTHGNRQESWATPIQGDSHLASTPDVAQKRIEEGKVTLSRQVASQWATPQTRDNRSGGAERWDNPNKSRNLNDQIAAETIQNAKLNPRWVEALMGLAIGWTMPSCGQPIVNHAHVVTMSSIATMIDSRVDELRLLGNGVVPACAALAFTTLFNELQETH